MSGRLTSAGWVENEEFIVLGKLFNISIVVYADQINHYETHWTRITGTSNATCYLYNHRVRMNDWYVGIHFDRLTDLRDFRSMEVSKCRGCVALDEAFKAILCRGVKKSTKKSALIQMHMCNTGISLCRKKSGRKWTSWTNAITSQAELGTVRDQKDRAHNEVRALASKVEMLERSLKDVQRKCEQYERQLSVLERSREIIAEDLANEACVVEELGNEVNNDLAFSMLVG